MYLKKIKKYLKNKIKINFIEIYNDSKLHKNFQINTLTHIKIIIVSDDFINKSLIVRHKLIFNYLKHAYQKKIYSITLYTYTLHEWKYKKYNNIDSMKCIKNISKNTFQ